MSNPDLYFNRELSWLKFNQRVLEEAFDTASPLFERLKFTSIFTSNLDEFYMVRVGSLFDQTLVAGPAENKTGMSPQEQIDAINSDVRLLYPLRDKAYAEINAGLSKLTVSHTDFKSLDAGEKRIVKEYYDREMMPVLSPQVIDSHHPFPHLENKQIYMIVKLKSKDNMVFGIIPSPPGIERVYQIPRGRAFLLAEDILLKYGDSLFEGYKVESKSLFRVTRNADIQVDEGLFDQDTDYRSIMQDLLRKRSRLAPVRLEMCTETDHDLREFLLSKLNLRKDQCFYSDAPLDLSFIFSLEQAFDPSIRGRLLFPPCRPQWPATVRHNSMVAQAQQGDILLSFPFESMRPFIELLREASEDPRVVSIKITLYRLARQSQIVQHLCTAAENGKEVTVIVELRARFDEQNNINWSRMLEESGCNVIYGVDEYKVHSKIMLITRRANRGFEYITQIGTGNYNENTARQYTDLSIITSSREIGEDAVNFFHNLTIANLNGSYRHLLVSPSSFKSGMLSLIEEERKKAIGGGCGRIIAKVNSLTDKELMDALIEAGKSGVKIELIIRGICCLRPGVPGYTDNITVRSIVGRYLEHSRIYLFGEGAERRIYIASADMMTRNTQRRVEIAAPVLDRKLVDRIASILNLLLCDNVKARLLRSDGIYTRIEGGSRVDSQQELYLQACDRVGDLVSEEIAASNLPRQLIHSLTGRFFSSSGARKNEPRNNDD